MLTNSLLMTKGTMTSKLLGEDIVDLSTRNFRIPELFSYTIIEVTRDQVARPDLISLDLYESDMYGDLLCKINNISNPFELNEGDRLVVPTSDCIALFFVEDDYVEEDNKLLTKPLVKKKKEKRRANEAVVGDTRFKVDAQNRLVIY